MAHHRGIWAICAILALGLTLSASATFVINEIDSDQASYDSAEFVELKGDPSESGSGVVLVFFNGSTGVSYYSVDLAGSADADGYYVVGNPGVNEAQETFDPGFQGFLQNGEDAVAIYSDTAANFPNGTAPTSTNLIDFVVYETGPDTNADWSGFGGSVTVFDEDGSGTKDTSSLARIPDGAGGVGLGFQVSNPTPGESNSAPTTPEVGLNVTEIDYGNFNADNTGNPAERTVRITNVGAGTLNVTLFGIQTGSDAVFTISAGPTPPLPAALTAGQDVEITVQFANSDTGSDQTFTGNVEYTTDAPVDPSGTVPLSATFVTIQQTASAGDIVINELCADPNPGTPYAIQDYNGDGTGSSTADEFTELFNTTASPINVQGWELTATSGTPEFTDTEVIGIGVTIEANGHLVFFQGGTPTGFDAGVAHVGNPALGNSGETVALSDGTTDIDVVSYGNREGLGGTDTGVTSDGGSIGLMPDGTLPFVEFPWNSATQPPSPGLANGTVIVTATSGFEVYR